MMVRLGTVGTSLVVIVLSGLLAAPSGWAQQSMGDVLKSIERSSPERRESAAPPVIESAPKGAPAAEGEGKRVQVTRFRISGNTLIDAGTLQAAVAPFEGKALTLPELQQAADAVTAQYRARGYLIAYAYVPAQEVQNGEVSLSVVESRVGALSVTGNRSYSTSFIENRFRGLTGTPGLKQEALERPLILLNEFTDLRASALLKAGSTPGTTDIAVKVADRRPVAGTVWYDNYGNEVTSKNRAGAALGLGNLVASGDLLSLSGVLGIDGDDWDSLVYTKADYSIPVGSWGTKAGAYYAYSHYRAGDALEDLDKYGQANLFGFYANFPVLRERARSADVWAGFDYKNVRDHMWIVGWTEDDVRLVKTGVSFNASDRFRGRNLLGAGYYLGLGSLLGGSESGDDTGREGADNSFNKFTLDLARFQSLGGYNLLILRGQGQYSPDKLMNVEQFSVGGQGTVRGYPLSSANGDSGWFASAEVEVAPYPTSTRVAGRPLGELLRFALFFDRGAVYLNHHELGEGSEYLTGVGAGVRVRWGDLLSAKLDYAVPVEDGAFRGSDSITYVQAAVQF